jgi:hypothetical protein
MNTELDPLKDGMAEHESQVEQIIADKMNAAAEGTARAIVDELVPILDSHNKAQVESLTSEFQSYKPASPDVEAIVGFFEAHPLQKAAFLKNVGEKLGLPIAKQIQTVILPTKGELAAKARDIIVKTLNAHSIAIHRDAVHYLVEAIAEAFHVAPPVDPEEVKGVG